MNSTLTSEMLKKMGKTISINIQKGGCGKTTTVQSLAGCLSKKGYKCLVIDLDPQANLSFSSDVQVSNCSVYEFLKGTCSFDAAVQKTKYYDIVPANISLSGSDHEFTETVLRNVLDPVKDKYDYILYRIHRQAWEFYHLNS